MKIKIIIIFCLLTTGIFCGCFENQDELLIKSFTINPNIINKSGNVTISWIVIGATKVSIDNGIGYVNLTGTIVITVNETTTFILTAKNDKKTITSSVKVTVKDLLLNNSIIIDDELYNNAPRDPFEIEYLRIYKDTLEIDIIYSGGCGEHDFYLISKENFMESDPVQIHCVLSHKDNNDPCDSIVSDRLLIDLTPLKEKWQQEYQSESGRIIMLLKNYSESILYIFGEDYLSFLNAKITTDKTVYESNENISIQIYLINNKDTNITILLPSSQVADFEVINEQGSSVYLWSFDKAFAEVITPITIPQGKTLEIFKIKWDQLDNNGSIVPPGIYKIRGWIPGSYYSDDETQYEYGPVPNIYSNEVIITIIG